MITLDEALSKILPAFPPGATERVTLNEAIGRRLAEDILAPQDSPPFDNSAMDGFAFVHPGKGSHRFEVIGEISAGMDASALSLEPGQAVRIMTGAQVPKGADTVAMREVCEAQDRQVLIKDTGSPGDNIRTQGSSMKQGEAVLKTADLVHAGEIGLLASFRKLTLEVFARPRIAVLTTGDELLEPDHPPRPGAIVNSNAWMLEALIKSAGGLPYILPIARDDPDSIRNAFRRAIDRSDLVISVGGVSVGDYDFVRQIMDELCQGIEFWKVKLKPGKPLAFGKAGNTPLLGLPGNPVSAFVGFHVFVAPAIKLMQGVSIEESLPIKVAATLANDARSTAGRQHLVCGRMDLATGLFHAFEDPSSGNLKALVGTNALGDIPDGVGFQKAQTRIDVLLLNDPLC